MTLSGSTFTKLAIGLTCVLAVAVDPAPAMAQARHGATPRHGSHQVGRHERVAVPRYVRPARMHDRLVVHANRGPNVVRVAPHGFGSVDRRFVPRTVASRSYVSRPYGVRFVDRSYQRRHGGFYRAPVYRQYYRPYYRPYYPYYRPYYPYPRTFVSFGLGFGYPYGFWGYPYGPHWAPYTYYGGYGYGYAPYPYGYGYPYAYGRPSNYAPDHGGIRLQVTPKDATVYADGFYVGIVDDFDGSFQRLALEAGPHKLEIRAPGFEPFTLDVNIIREETIKYRGPLRPLP
jgi:hypothetical protein